MYLDATFHTELITGVMVLITEAELREDVAPDDYLQKKKK